MATKEQLLKQLEPTGQTHVLTFWDQLDEAGRQKLADQLQQIDLRQLQQLAASAEAGPDWTELARRADSPPAVRLAGISQAARQEARARGEEALRAGEVGMILVAGGQGTRLGFDHPKGLYPIGPVSGRCLFQILLENLRARGLRYGAPIPLYLMTSPATHAETVAALRKQNHFGLAPDQVHVFCQGTMPAVDAKTGKLLLAERDSLCLSPDGHGGMLSALSRSGHLQGARERGLKVLFYGQIDNPLLTVCDPELIGWHLLEESEMTTQVVEKIDPLERVGNLVSVDGRVQILEYSDLPERFANGRNEEGGLRLWAGNIAVHVFSLSFLEQAQAQSDSLPFHRALKKVPYLDGSGRRIDPEQPNAIKFERFIFDLLPQARRALAVEAERRVAFAPVKNADGAAADTPASAKAALVALHRRWLEAAGAQVADGVPVEISGLWALDADDVRRKLPPGTRIDRSTYFGPDRD